MTLYKAMKMTRNATDEGWIVHMPDGTENEYAFWGYAMDEIMDNPRWLTLTVESMEMDSDKVIHLHTAYGSEYIANLSSLLGDDELCLGIDEAIRLVTGAKPKEQITLGELYTIADVLENTVSVGDLAIALEMEG